MSDFGRLWTRASIHQILTNEKYIGSNIFNRVSYKLKQRRVVNHPDTWVRADGVVASERRTTGSLARAQGSRRFDLALLAVQGDAKGARRRE
jgi:hypothetical protein